MRPAASGRAWRKGLRAASKGLGRGRRATHRPISTLGRRRRLELLLAGTDRLITDLKTQEAPADAAAEANPTDR
jgi:hypothetical protein